MKPLVCCIGSCRLKASLDYLKKKDKIKINQVARYIGWTYYTKETLQLLQILQNQKLFTMIPKPLHKWIFRKSFFLRIIDTMYRLLLHEFKKVDIVIIEISSLKSFKYDNYYFNMVNTNDYLSNFLNLELSNLFKFSNTYDNNETKKLLTIRPSDRNLYYNLDMIEAYYTYKLHRKNLDKKISKNIRKKNITPRFVELVDKIANRKDMKKTNNIFEIRQNLNNKFPEFVEDLQILNNIEVKIQNHEEILEDILQIKKILGNKKLIIVSHYNYAKYDTNLDETIVNKINESRGKMIQYLEKATQKLGIKFIDPTDIVGIKGIKDSEHLSGKGAAILGNHLLKEINNLLR